MDPVIIQSVEMKLAKVDLSALPFNLKLSLVTMDEVQDHLKPPKHEEWSHAIRLTSNVFDVNSDQVIELQTHQACITHNGWINPDLDRSIMDLVIGYICHEVRERALFDGQRKYNPHEVNYEYYIKEMPKKIENDLAPKFGEI